MNKYLLIVLMCLLLLALAVISTSCGATVAQLQPTPTAEMGAANAAVELIQQSMYIQLTQQALESQRIETGARLTATQQVIAATSTQQANQDNAKATQKAEAATAQVWRVTVEAGQAQDTATAQAAANQATASAEVRGTATQQALLGVTATIQMRQTDSAEAKTQQAPFVAAQQTAVKAQSDSAKLAADRERMTNGVIAWGPWIIALVACVAFVFVLIRKSQVGTIERDQNGLMPGVVIFHRGQKQFISPDRLFAPVLTLDAQGISAPQLADPDRQEGATRRAQAVEAINALPPQTQRQGMGLMAQSFNQPTPRASLEVLEPKQVSGWLDEAESGLNEEL
jgi:hypothetical protein